MAVSYCSKVLLFVLMGALLMETLSSSPRMAEGMPQQPGSTKSKAEFLKDVFNKTTPSKARLVAQLFGGLELEVLPGTQALITVGGATTKCQYQSPCYDTKCGLCYDPLLRIHGRCGGASYFTCSGTLPRACLPYTCTLRPSITGGGPSSSTLVFVKKFPKYKDMFCLEGGAASRDGSGRNLLAPTPEGIQEVYEPVTECHGFDTCLDSRCTTCYDPYLGIHTTCGDVSYYDCSVILPEACQAVRCSSVSVFNIFQLLQRQKRQAEHLPDYLQGAEDEVEAEAVKEGLDGGEGRTAGASGEHLTSIVPLMVRSYLPLTDQERACWDQGHPSPK